MNATALEEWCLGLLESRHSVPSELSPRAKLTVVIVSYCRQDFILRQLAYWGQDAAKVVIVDGSPKPLGRFALDVVVAQRNITYVHLPENLTARLELASGHIDTPYAVFMGDDEFLLKDGLSLAIEKLDADPGLVACIGQSLGFYLSSKGAACTYGRGYPHWRYEVMQNAMQDRLITAMRQYNAATCYAVLRRPVWARSWGALENWSSPYVGEMQQAFITYIWGKVGTIDEVYWLRSGENPPVSNVNFDRKLSFRDWWLSPKFENERQRFIELLSNEAVVAQSIRYPEAKKIVMNAISEFVSFLSKHEQSQKGKLTRSARIKSGVKVIANRVIDRLLPEAMRRGVKLGVSRLVGKPHQGTLGTLKDLTYNQCPREFRLNKALVEELVEIERLIYGFYKARRS